MLENDTTVLEQLKKNTAQFRSQMKAAGFTISGADECAIAPVMLYDAKLAADVSEEMLAQV